MLNNQLKIIFFYSNIWTEAGKGKGRKQHIVI